MQSLLLATSLVVSAPAAIDSLDNKAELNQAVAQQVSEASNSIMLDAELTSKDNFLTQAKMAIRSARFELVANTKQFDDAAE